MLEYEEVSYDTFFSAVKSIEYREDDIKEAKEFGCIDILNCYRKALKPFSRFFVVYEDDIPVCTILLRRDGNIVFFISKDIKYKIGLIRILRKLSKKVVRCCGSIITKTASWYDEALRMNKLIGFKPYKLYNKYGLYVLEK